MRLSKEELRRLAAHAGLSLVAVTTAEPFPDLAELLRERIRSGFLRGMDWFDEQRAEIAADPRRLHPTARSLVAVALPYWLPQIQPPADGVARGRIARYAWGIDYHRVLRERMERLHALLEARFGRTIEARFLVDTARIVDREVAARAGLGWQEKTRCCSSHDTARGSCSENSCSTSTSSQIARSDPAAVAAEVVSTRVRPAHSSLPTSSTPRAASRISRSSTADRSPGNSDR